MFSSSIGQHYLPFAQAEANQILDDEELAKKFAREDEAKQEAEQAESAEAMEAVKDCMNRDAAEEAARDAEQERVAKAKQLKMDVDQAMLREQERQADYDLQVALGQQHDEHASAVRILFFVAASASGCVRAGGGGKEGKGA